MSSRFLSPSAALLLLLALAIPVTHLTAAELHLTSPRNYEVIQRNAKNSGKIIVTGAFSGLFPPSSNVQARLLASNTLAADWIPLSRLQHTATGFQGEVDAPAGGWYRLEVRILGESPTLILQGFVEHVGVGEVFVICGQSNSANYGDEKQESKSGLVSAFTGKEWIICRDPQPGAGGNGGSFIPPFGDAIASQLKIPVGMIALGVGATSIREWLPAGAFFPNPPTLTNHVILHANKKWQSDGVIFDRLMGTLKPQGTNGFRAILWHQGESDANQKDDTRTLRGSEYQRLLQQLILSSRDETGWSCPWFVAQASYHSPDDPGSPEIRAAQRALWQSGVALQGPDTDSLSSNLRSNGGKGVHFSGAGLRAHAQLWADKVLPWLQSQVPSAATSP
ncbi:MAG: hypothetical protein JWN25_42 [Verrucomicrobiales bacterium]|nr:hypothetical protein [Verrucomicrobiales bacterium]